jgi:hypothetical protein
VVSGTPGRVFGTTYFTLLVLPFHAYYDMIWMYFIRPQNTNYSNSHTWCSSCWKLLTTNRLLDNVINNTEECFKFLFLYIYLLTAILAVIQHKKNQPCKNPSCSQCSWNYIRVLKTLSYILYLFRAVTGPIGFIIARNKALVHTLSYFYSDHSIITYSETLLRKCWQFQENPTS